MSFEVWWTPTAIASAQGLDRPIARRVDEAEAELERAGCAAAGYRLTGELAERICVVHLVYDYRMLTAFPSVREVAILLIGRHTRSPSLDIYARLYRALEIGVPAGERTKPPCCDEDEAPPVDEQLVERFREGVKRLRREEGRFGRAHRSH